MNVTKKLKLFWQRNKSLSISNDNYFVLIYLYNSLAEELLKKETINLTDILRVLGDRPYPLKENVREYLEELG